MPAIPDKFYFKIGEVSTIADVAPHVLRFWEAEFPRIAPKRTASGQRLYSRKDVELILEIKHLLYQRRYTIAGARRLLRHRASPGEAEAPSVLEEIRSELEQLRRMLD